jgi:protocatechuate 3,4-dioxygenase beta subunit
VGDGFHFVALAPGRESEVEVRLFPGAIVRGRVLDADGSPSPRAVVEAAPVPLGRSPEYDPSRLYERSVAAGDDGRFRVSHLAVATPYRFRARAPDRLETAWSEPVTGAADDAEPPFVLLRFGPTRELVVVLRDVETDAPLRGVRVSARGLDSSSETDSFGRCALLLPPASATVQVDRADGYLVPVTLSVSAEAREVTLHLVPERTIAGRALPGDAEPLDWGSVLASPDFGFDLGGNPGVDAQRSVHAAVAPDGTFLLRGLRAGRHRVVVEATRGLRRFHGSVIADANSLDLRVPLVERASLPLGRQVRVLDASGNPVPNARGLVRREGSAVATTVIGGLAFVGSPEEDLVVAFFDARGADGQALPLGVARARLLPGVADDVRLPPEEVFEGRVLLEEGGPAPGVLVYAAFVEDLPAAHDPGRTDLRVSTSVTDAGGTFRFRGLSGAGLVAVVVAPADRVQPDAVALRTDERPTVVLHRPIDREVFVLDGSGAPVAGASVVATVPGRPSPRVTTAVTDAAGRAVLQRLDPSAPASLEVSLREPGRARRTSLERWTGESPVVLPRLASVAGRVLDAEGRPARSATVRAWASPGEEERRAYTDRNGGFRFDDLPEGKVEVLAWANPLAPSAPLVVSAPREDLAISLPRTEELLVHVRGAPRGSLGVAALAAGARETLALRSTAEANESGEFRFQVAVDVPVVFLSTPALRPGSPPAWIEDLRAGLVVSTEPHRAGAVSGSVRASPPLLVREVAARRGPLEVRAPVTPDGTFRFDGLPDGPWTIEARTIDGEGRPLTASAAARPGESVELTFAR